MVEVFWYYLSFTTITVHVYSLLHNHHYISMDVLPWLQRPSLFCRLRSSNNGPLDLVRSLVVVALAACTNAVTVPPTRICSSPYWYLYGPTPIWYLDLCWAAVGNHSGSRTVGGGYGYRISGQPP